ncbi:MAG TPA: hypothetical protein VMZ73_04560 [Acidimicrobiales bacterium]|nr:hypothetical protein [Acidimicrobiales bacterium]
MRKKVAGLLLATSMLVGVGPLATAAYAHETDTTDPVLCFVAAQSIITEALHEYREGHLTARQLRAVLLGTSSFLGDCLTPSS